MIEEQQDKKQQAEALRNSKRYAEAVTLYAQLWPSDDKWIGWGYAICLRKLKRSDEALEICRDVYRMDSNFDRNNNVYGWCIYDVGIKQDEQNFDEVEFLKAARAITQITQQGNYSPYVMAVFAVIHHYEKYKQQQKPIPHDRIIRWLEKLDPDTLSTQPNRVGEYSYPSPKEDWYSSWAKALLGTQRYEECIAVCTEALAAFDKFHYSYDVWFRQYRAESYLALKQGERALSDLEYMMAHKPDAWVRHKYALALYSLGRLSEAIQYACEAALPHNRLGFRWEAYLDLGNMLAESGEIELATRHIQLAVAIRRDEGWQTVPLHLQHAIHNLEVPLNDLPDAQTLHRELQPFWKSQKPRPKTTHTGVIDLIHSNGKSGMIRADDGKRYFFGRKNYVGGNAEPVTGMPVAFNLRETTNRNTQKPEMHAVDIHDVV